MKSADFKPPWWLRSPHMQTLWPVFFKKRHKLDLESEQVELEDGDFIDLRWSKKDTGKVVLVLHGLEGSIDSHYANGIMFQLENAGYRPVFMYFRGCSGRVNRLPRAYHSGETGDVARIAEHIKEKSGCYPYAAVAYSLGGNVLLKWLGETAEKNMLQKAVAVSVPFRLGDAAKRLETGFSKIYRDHLLVSLRKTYTEKFKTMTSPLDIDVRQLKSFWDYDDKVTAPLHGFSGAQDYYDRCSSRQFLKDIHVPTRIIHSSDDPFMFDCSSPESTELSDAIDFQLTDEGGHVGFVAKSSSSRSFWRTEYWCEKMIIDFLLDD